METMVNSVKSVSISTPSLNKIGFAAEKEAAQVSLETPKDEFTKSSAVKKGALAGAGIAIARLGYMQIKGAFLSNSYKEILTHFSKSKAITGTSIIVAIPIAISAAVGAGIGKIVKHFGKKESPMDELTTEKSHAVRNGALAGAVAFVSGIAGNVVYMKKKFNFDFAGVKPFIIIPLGCSTLIGAGIGAIVKHFGKKESPMDELATEKSHAVRNGALAGATAGLALVGKSVYSNIKVGNRLSLIGIGLVAAPFALAGSAIGATIGKVVKMVSKKD